MAVGGACCGWSGGAACEGVPLPRACCVWSRGETAHLVRRRVGPLGQFFYQLIIKELRKITRLYFTITCIDDDDDYG